jgi:uncharacterized membrane protein YbhN (UPF0104 family)
MTRALRPWVRVLAGAGILAVVVWRLGTGAFVDGLRLVDGGAVLAALAIGLLTTVLSAWRWCLVARGLGLRLPLPTAVADYYRALLLNAVLPTGVLGDVHRAVNHGRDAGDVGRGVRAVVLERVAGQVVITVAGVTVLLTQPALVSGVARELVPSREVAFAVLSVLAVVIVLTARTLRGRATSKGRRALATAWADARLGLLARGTWPAVVVLSATALLGHVTLFLVAAHIAGSSASVVRLVPPMVLALLAMGLPVNIGGWGPREAVSALAFGAAGMGAPQGLTTAVVYGILALAASLPGAMVLIFRYRRSPPRESRIERYSPNDSTRLARTFFPFAGEASDGRPTMPDSV